MRDGVPSRPGVRKRPRSGGTGHAIANLGELHAVANDIAPFELAAEWDNVGLLAGNADWPARRIALALDLTDAVAAEILREKCEALVVYHPPIFKGVRSIGPRSEGPTSRLADLLAARVGVIALHTALDAAIGGTNDILLDSFETAERYPLEPIVRERNAYKLVTFVLAAEAARLRETLSRAGAGRIGHYSECSFELSGRGTFKGDESSNPSIGRRQVLESVAELRVEMVVPRAALGAVVRALYATHSYEEPAFDLYPVDQLAGRGAVGLARVGVLRKAQRGEALVERLGRRVDLACATTVGDLRRRFSSVTAAAGAFGVRSFRDAESLVVTGEMKHHDALELLRRGVTAVCLGHYASEQPLLEVVRRRIAERMRGATVRICKADRSPFAPVAARRPNR